MEYTATSGKLIECPCYKMECIPTATSGVHAEIIKADYVVTDKQNNPTSFGN